MELLKFDDVTQMMTSLF